MAGMQCPKCKKLTVFNTPTGKRCSNPECNYEVIAVPNNGKGGKGKKCLICGKSTVFNNICTNCGARTTY